VTLNAFNEHSMYLKPPAGFTLPVQSNNTGWRLLFTFGFSSRQCKAL